MRGLLALALLIGCDRSPGAVHLVAPGVAGELVVDQEHRGPVQADQTLELPPGEHRIAIWRGPSELVASVVEVRSRMVVEVVVDPEQLPDAIAARDAAREAEERAARERAEAERAEAERAEAERVEAAAREARAQAEQRAALDEAARAPAVLEALAEEGRAPRRSTGLLAELLDRTRALSRTCRAHVQERTQILLRVHVTGAGVVDRASVDDAHTAAGQCVRNEARRWRFAPTHDDSEIQLPVVLSP